MVNVGKYNELYISKIVDFGAYLDGGDSKYDKGWGEILLPKRYLTNNVKVGEKLKVFIYFDSEDRITATTEKPKAISKEFAYLQVVDVNKYGAFLDWGLPKDLLVPYSEQTNKMRKGMFYIVYIFEDEKSKRITASSKVNRFLNKNPSNYSIGQQVKIMIMAITDLGYKVIINNKHIGMIYHNEIFEEIKIGQELKANIKKIRKDNKIDLSLTSPNKAYLSELEYKIIDSLENNNGKIMLSDKTPAKEIYRSFSVSKKNFKRAISHLYKQHLINIMPDYISITKK